MINDFSLVVLTEKQQKINLHLQKYTIGRHPNCDICLHDKFISRWHCTLVLNQSLDAGYFYTLWDGIPLQQASTQGTFVNGRMLHKTILKNEDIMTFSSGQEYPQIVFFDKSCDYEKTSQYSREIG